MNSQNFIKNIITNNLISSQMLILMIKGENVIENDKNVISKCDLKLLAYKLLSEFKKYFADEKIQKEFQKWIKTNNKRLKK